MKSKLNQLDERILTILKIDAKNLFDRIKNRFEDYIEVFALKRTRDHFLEIFKNRYDDTTLKELSHCSSEIITSLDAFYTEVDNLKWYLYHTEDMPNTVSEKVLYTIRKLERFYSSLELYLNAELGFSTESNNDVSLSEESSLDLSQLETQELIEEK